MVELHWPRRSTFRDAAGDGDTVRYQQGTHDVPEGKEARFRERGWVDPPEDQEADAPDVAEQPTEESEADAESADEGFDAAGFVDDSWQSVVSRIEDGDADGHLDAVREAEEDRDSPRSSVIEALEQRG